MLTGGVMMFHGDLKFKHTFVTLLTCMLRKEYSAKIYTPAFL
jgi:hypothetical protein